MDSGGDLEAVEENTLLSLEKDVSWPSDESGQVTFMLDAVSDSEIAGTLFEKGVLLAISALLIFLSLSASLILALIFKWFLERK